MAIAGAPEQDDWLLQAAASLDLLHVSALVHDDVMDGSDTRRGAPSVHRQLETWHRDEGGRGPSDAFGRAGAILLGDLLLVWSTEMFDHADLPPDEAITAAKKTVKAAGEGRFPTSADTIKGKAILRDGRVSLCVDDEAPQAAPAGVSTDTDVIDLRQGAPAAQDRYASDPIGTEVVEEWTEDDDEDAWSLTDRR